MTKATIAAETAPPARAEGAGAARGPLLAAAVLMIVVAASLFYLPHLNRPFFADDYLFLDQVRDKSLLAALQSVDPLSNFYRPISRQLYFWIVSTASGESEVAYHATSVALFG